MKLKFFTMLAVVVVLLADRSPARAQSIVFVSATGVDTSNLTCSETSPCATLGHAITEGGGGSGAGVVVNCLTPGNFSILLLSISGTTTINCPGGVVNGVDVNFSATGNAVIRGLDVEGSAGLQVSSGTLVLDNVSVHGATFGFVVQGGNASVSNSVFSGNGNGVVVNGGVLSLSRVEIENNTSDGLLIDGPAGETKVNLTDSVVANNGGNGINIAATSSNARQFLTVQRTSTIMNGMAGLAVTGSEGFALIGESSVAWNGTGYLVSSGGALFSYKNNQVNGNGTDISGTVNPAPLF